MKLLVKLKLARKRMNTLSSMPKHLVWRREDRTWWTTANNVSFADAMKDLWSGGSWIFDRLRRDKNGVWYRTGERWTTRDHIGWEVIALNRRFVKYWMKRLRGIELSTEELLEATR